MLLRGRIWSGSLVVASVSSGVLVSGGGGSLEWVCFCVMKSLLETVEAAGRRWLESILGVFWI